MAKVQKNQSFAPEINLECHPVILSKMALKTRHFTLKIRPTPLKTSLDHEN